MKHYSTGMIQAYIDQELSDEKLIDISQHLTKCEQCQTTVSEITHLNQFEEKIMKTSAPTESIYVDIDHAYEKFNKQVAKQKSDESTQKKGLFKPMTKKVKFILLTAAIVFIGAGISLTPQVKVIGEHLNSYLADNVSNDEVIKSYDGNEHKVGRFISLDQKISNNGITLNFNEAYLTEGRLSVHYTVTDSYGEVVPFDFDTSQDTVLEDQKGQEHPVIEGEEDSFSVIPFLKASKENRLPFELVRNGAVIETGIRDTDKPEGVVTFVSMLDQEPWSVDNKLSINVSVQKIGTVTGSWEGNILIN